MDGPKLKPGEVNLGTTIMAVQYADGVVVAADSRTTMGSYIANRVTDKLTQIHERIFCCRSGSAADTQAVADIVHYHLQLYSVQEGVLPKVETAANMFQRVVYENKDQLMAGIIIETIYHWRVWLIYIYGYCDANYKDNMTREEAVQFTKNAVSLAMSRDGSSGGTIRLAIITKDAVERIFVPGNELPTFWEN
ncbi:hypothetical protein BASA60_001692 [Batrachochytrium salamandrivorans]|nr:hypothetical protein BASA60_001692 [Batrachochytrium salamandrivorans]